MGAKIIDVVIVFLVFRGMFCVGNDIADAIIIAINAITNRKR